MKHLSAEAVEQIESRRPTIAGAAKFGIPSGPDGSYRFASGVGKLTIESEEFIGVGSRALIIPTASRIGGSADGYTITLSGLDPRVADTIENEDYHQTPVTIWKLVFNATGRVLLDVMVDCRGRLNFVKQREKVGGMAALDFMVEGPRRDLSRAGARVRSDADQRVLGGAQDDSLAQISVAPRKTLRWGQHEITGGGALGGGRGLLGPFGGGGLGQNV